MLLIMPEGSEDKELEILFSGKLLCGHSVKRSEGRRTFFYIFNLSCITIYLFLTNAGYSPSEF